MQILSMQNLLEEKIKTARKQEDENDDDDEVQVEEDSGSEQ
jgi:hypothetical protein